MKETNNIEAIKKNINNINSINKKHAKTKSDGKNIIKSKNLCVSLISNFFINFNYKKKFLI